MADGGGDEGGGWFPRGQWSHIAHYHGDIIRQLMLGAAAIMVFAAPFYRDADSVGLSFIVIGAIVLVCLAALTNPWKKSILIGDAVANGVGFGIFQLWALYGYDPSFSIAFVLREAISILFMFAFYFSIKTVRAMILGHIGKRDRVAEFEKPELGSQVHERVDRRGD